jgi:hypothetical protein
VKAYRKGKQVCGTVRTGVIPQELEKEAKNMMKVQSFFPPKRVIVWSKFGEISNNYCSPGDSRTEYLSGRPCFHKNCST